MKRRHRAIEAVGALLLLHAMSGCAPPLPPFDEVRSDTVALMQEVVDALPPGTTVTADESHSSWACDTGSGSFYSGYWVATTPNFDTGAFVESLPGTLGPSWSEDTDALDAGVPSIILLNGETTVRVSAIDDDDGTPRIGIIAISPCGQKPDDVDP